MDDRDALVEDLVYQCLAARATGSGAALDELLAPQPATVREQVKALLDTLDRLGLGDARNLSMAPGATPFGRYLLIERLGSGAMGVVYRARDPSGVERALKLLQPGLLPVHRARLRFEREILALRVLDHPGICPILDAGEVDGVPFLVMPLLSGESLQAVFARGRARDESARRELLARVEQIAVALHHAHARGFVHRDLKPANIMVCADGRPVVLDFGLARLDRDATPALSLSHEIIGAPAYMAPEQIADGAAVDRRADVYALGVLLHEGLTGRCPYQATTRESLYRAILTGDCPPPSRHVGELPAAYDVVCLTALARDSDRRYQSAADLAADLARVRAGKRPHAQLPDRLERLVRWTRRNPLPSTLLALLMLAVIGLVYQTCAERWASQRDRARVLAARAFEVLDADPDRALQLGREGHALAPELLECVTAIEAARTAMREEFVLTGHTDAVVDLDFTADGARLCSASIDGTARLWQLAAGRSLTLEHGGGGVALARYRPDGELVATVGRTDGRLCAWRAESGALAWQSAAHPAGSAVQVLLWSLDGRWLLTGGDGGARVWASDGSSREVLRCAGAVTAATWLADDEVAVGTGALEGNPAPEPLALQTFRIGDAAITRVTRTTIDDSVVALHPRPKAPGTVLVVGSSKTAFLWQAKTGELKPLPQALMRGVHSAGWSADGLRAFTAARGLWMVSWSPNGVQQATMPIAFALRFAPNPRLPYAAIGGGVGDVQLRSLDGSAALQLGRGRLRAQPLAFSANGQRLATCGWDGSIGVWPLWRPEHPLFFDGNIVRTAVWSTDGRRIVTGSSRPSGDLQGVVRAWDVSRGELLESREFAESIYKLVVDPARQRVVSLVGIRTTGQARVIAGLDGHLRADGREMDSDQLKAALPAGQALADGRLILAQDEEGVLVADLESGRVEQRLRVPHATSATQEGFVFAVCATPDGATLWCGGSTGTLYRFDRSPDGSYSAAAAGSLGEAIRVLEYVDDGSLLIGCANGVLQRLLVDGSIVRFHGHRDDVTALHSARLGGELLLASGDVTGAVRLWRGDGTPLRDIRAHAAIVWSVRFSPTSDRVLSGSADGTVRIWPVEFDVAR